MRPLGPVGGAVALAILSLLPASASAQTAKPQQGTPMSLSPAEGDEAFGCETRFQAGFDSAGTYEKQPTGVDSCTAYQPGTTIADTHLVPGPGTVTKVRVRSGSNPGPLRVTVIKRLFQTNPNNPAEITDAQCCTGTGRESATFQPTPNAVTEVTVNLPVTTSQSRNGASGHHDIVSISGVGPGNLPIASTGEHSLSAGIQRSTPTMQIFYPKVETGLQGEAQHDYANYVVLMNYDWVAPSSSTCASASGARASQACRKAPATVSGKTLRLKKGKVKVKVRCTAGAGTRCRGTLRLRTRAKKPRLLASKKMNVAGGKKATITIKLSKKARKRLKKKSTKVRVEIDLGALGKTSKNMKLKR